MSLEEKVVEVKYHFFGDGFVGFCTACVKIGSIFHFVNVYSPCILAGKHKLWADLVMSKRVFSGSFWYVEDFNAISFSKERRGHGF